MKNNLIILFTLVSALLFPAFGQAQVTCNPSFTYAQTGANPLHYTFTNTTPPSTTTSQFFHMTATPTGSFPMNVGTIAPNGGTAQYTFNGPGVYMVILYMSDSSAQGVYCNASDTQTVVVTGPNPANTAIQGNIIADSLNSPGVVYPNLSFKVWLIQYDASTNMLSAVDSQVVSGTNVNYVSYSFNNQPNGNYLVKAKDLLNLNNNGSYFVPTYHLSSLYWGSASTINHNNAVGASTGKHIFMLSGAQTSGPGFIGGDVTQGANRPAGGTTLAIGDPVSNLDVYLKDEATGTIVGYTTTDMQGHYSFTNLPLGTYTVFPEALNFETIADEHITLVNGQPGNDQSDFTQNATQIKPVNPTSLKNVAVELVGVYPNPVTHTVYINWKNPMKDVTVKMYNMIGAEVYASANQVTEIDMSHLAKGVYVLKVNAGNAVQTLKLTKQ